MYRQHARLFAAIQFVSDLGLTSLAFVFAYHTRIHLELLVPARLSRLLNPELHPLFSYWWVVAISSVVWSIVSYSLGLYRLSIRRSDWEKIRVIGASAILLGLFLGFLSFSLKADLSRPLIALFILYQALLLSLARLAVTTRWRSSRRPVNGQRNILIVGSGDKALEMGRLVSRYSDWGLRILGYIARDREEQTSGEGKILGAISDIPRIVEEMVVDEIIFVGNRPRDLESLSEVLAICREQGIRTSVAIDMFPSKVSNVSMEFLENVPLLTFSTTPDHAFSLFVKRIMDVILSALLLLVLSPFLLVVGVLIRLTSSGPMIYRQIRCGLYGRKFVLFKFRSMKDGAEDVLWEIKHLNEMDGPVFKMRNDPRVTPLGRFLRKSSVDELPQLWNVLKGDMSLVGPRAPLPDEVREYSRWQRRRLSVKPGITCLWQVSGRNEIDFHEWMRLDLQYIDNWSLLLDVKILLRTFPIVLMGKGAR
ncbi:MAG: Undecaprenyl-phosphate galactose phosphotransferase [Acidobacteria bacterium]|nr:Undecaprenyl-phosphate galactose phosphotransferase [Acidobacteriota bacterium]